MKKSKSTREQTNFSQISALTSNIPVLFVHSRSNYKKNPLFDCYDEKRNALNFNSNQALIAHPPCRLWSQLRSLSKAPQEEKNLAIFALKKVRENGGILEHPATSTFWKFAKVVRPGYIDEFGGFTICINQSWFGYYTEKKTIFYIVGIKPKELPTYPIILGSYNHRKFANLTVKQRSETTIDLCIYLASIIQLINQKKVHTLNA